jgi:hypothetical protein
MSTYYPEARINLSCIFDGLGGPEDPVVLTDILPFSCNVHLNSYKEADTWEIVFDAKRFPFSPELVKSMAVEIYLYHKTDQTVNAFWHDPSNLLSTGLVDQMTLTEDSEGGKVSLSGRDYTSLLIDRQWDPSKSGHGGRVPDGNLEDVVQALVDEATLKKISGRTLTVKTFDDSNVKISSVSNTVTHNKVTIKKTVNSSKSRKPRGVSVKADSTYWDVIYKLCLAYGFIVFVKGFEVWITPPHVLQSVAQTQFHVAYGRNLEKLEVERKMSKEATPQIRVRSTNPDPPFTPFEGRFPSDNDLENFNKGVTQKKGVSKISFGSTGIGVKKEEFKVFSIPDVKDQKTLVDFAKATYFTLARGEGVIRFATPHLRDLKNADLLAIRAGDSVMIEWDAFNAEQMQSKESTPQSRYNILISLGYSPDVAALVSENYSKLDYFRQPFYVKECNITWDKDSGVKIDVEAMNFINPNLTAAGA